MKLTEVIERFFKLDVTAETPVYPPECNGNACGDVSISQLGWGRGLLLKNTSLSQVGLRVRWDVGFSCLDWGNLELAPGETREVHIHGYCAPFEANYTLQDKDN
jgi:hypothetical protein